MKLNWKNDLAVDEMPNNKGLQKFLFQSGSLSLSIQNSCKGIFNIELKNESWSTPMADECELLSIIDSEITFIRESWLKCDNKKLVYARTIIPRNTYDNESHELGELGNKPLGNILFSDDSSYRANMKYAKISAQFTLHTEATLDSEVDSDLWGRQSLFFINNNPLLITEVFLPTILECS